MWRKIYGVLIVILNISAVVYGGGLTHCCSKASGVCRKKCELLKEPNNVKKFTRRWRKLTDIVARCPRGEIKFWKCLPTTDVWKDFISESKRRQRKPNHLICCKDAQHISCEILCRSSRNVTKILYNENCNKIREPKLSQCVAKIHASKQCCTNGAPNSECKEACIRYFRRSHNLDGKLALEKKCGTHSVQFKCVMRQSDYKDVIQEYKNCCGMTARGSCTRACKEGLENLKDMTAFFTGLIKECGKWDMQNPIYKCITKTSIAGEPRQTPVNEPPGPIAPIGNGHVESKGCCKQCCYRAKSAQCRNWCHGMTASPSLLGLWDTMYLACMQEPSEMDLSNCMYDILEPCQLGVKTEMKFCTNFNNRPLELFRRCDRHGDNEARKLYKLWSEGRVSVLEYTLVFKDVNKCKPEMFKAIACLLSIQPCDHQSSRKQVCRSDCEELLDSCLDHDKLDTEVDVKHLCASMLTNENQTGCIQVRDYITKPTALAVIEDEVTQPCNGNPCGSRKVCTINNKCFGESKRRRFCRPYICSEGCRQGNLMIPVGQLAKLRVDDHRNRECYQVCKCQRSRDESSVTFFDNCIALNCKKKRRCELNGVVITDGEVVSSRCNTCRCDDGELLCTKTYCGYDLNHLPSTSLCNCGDVYNPGCNDNGMTYPNPCVTRCCNEDSQFNGRCNFVDPCRSNPCARGRCVPKSSVLLNTSDCPRYVCIVELPDSTGCQRYGLDKKSDLVCGYDGISYKNKCLAYYIGTAVDYNGACLSNSEKMVDGKTRCVGVVCPQIDEGECHLFHPPGSCCPVCGSMLRILYSHRDITSHRDLLSNKPIAVLDIVNQMRQLQKVAECSLYGHRSLEGDLVILILVNTKRPTQRQIHACATEAERINKYINYGSPVMTTFYHLSILKVSRLKKAKWKDNNSSSSTRLFNLSKSYTILLSCTLLVLLLSNSR